MKTTRCGACLAEFSEEEISNAFACPGCGDKGVPLAIERDINVIINWQQLRVLIHWAYNFMYAHRDKFELMNAEKYLDNITASVEKQFPQYGPISMKGEIKELRQHFGPVETNYPGDPTNSVEELKKQLGVDDKE